MPLRPLRDFAQLLARQFVANRCPQVAGSLAFTTLLAIVPLVTVVIALFSNFPAFSALGISLKTFLLENLLPDRAGKIIATYAFQFSQKAAKLTLIGTGALVVTALMLLMTIDRVFNQIWGVRRPRPLLTRLTVHWFTLTLGPVALGATALATGHLVATSVAMVGNISWLAEFSSTGVSSALLCALFTFLYYGVPNHPVRPSHALCGGIAATGFFLLMQQLFGLFISRIPTYTLIYGTFATLPIFLLWLYLSWVVILLGAIIVASLPCFFERTRIAPPFPGDRAWTAVTMLVALAEAQCRGRPLAFESLLERARIGSHDGEQLLGELRDAGWVAQTEDGEWLLSRNSADIGLAAVISRFALSPADWRNVGNDRIASDTALRLEAALRTADQPIFVLAGLAPTVPAERQALAADPQIG
ncbi:MAG TPA: YihY family inner membrane protein [Aromatoleum sp.]|uniref:YihY family inner membrane protein n=1 Tax=Aromatoleum sp. TaxID=2307007 RepID=UPI002B483288|nr:YihY family inner membrane protein [Aromatoleum sp.]HJV27238.1 YihY family inner membrane protein [Aromatoleum sp.]